MTFMFPVGMCSVVRAEYIPRGRRQRHSALGEVSTVSLCILDNKTKFIKSTPEYDLVLEYMYSTVSTYSCTKFSVHKNSEMRCC